MSKLKAFNMPRYAGAFTTHEVHLKSEVDKVIAEKDKEIAELKKQVHDYAQGLYVMQARAEKEARHDKYKRCLSMAKWCELKRIDAADDRIQIKKWDFYGKWHKCWLIIAEKFKEAK